MSRPTRFHASGLSRQLEDDTVAALQPILEKYAQMQKDDLAIERIRAIMAMVLSDVFHDYDVQFIDRSTRLDKDHPEQDDVIGGMSWCADRKCVCHTTQAREYCCEICSRVTRL